jgi:molybdenum cofactor synthesis domain-containing protein
MTLMRASTYPMVTIESAIVIVLEHTSTLGTEHVSIAEALGRVLAESPVAADDMPPFLASAVDGYALIAGDGLAPRRVLSEIIAGGANGRAVTDRTAVRIMTGAPVPPGADAVVMVENVVERDGTMVVDAAPRAGDNLHRRGQDVSSGQAILAPGAALGPAEIGLLATVGHTWIRVYRRPIVAVLSTGDELVEPDQALRPGAIRDSNRYTLMASVREAGAEARSLGSVRDDEAEQEARIREGLELADVVLTSGGVSVGSRDLIKPILQKMGTIHFGRVAFKPGKPTTFATVDRKLVFGLPGFPVSSLVSFEVFVRPALRRLQGFSRIQRPVVQVEIEHDVQRSQDRPEYQRAEVRWSEGRLVARLTGIQRSSRLLSLVGANAFLRIDPGLDQISEGSRVDALLVGEILPDNA